MDLADYFVDSLVDCIDMLTVHFIDVPVAVQVESLHCFSYLCLQSEVRLPIQFLAEFPSLLVPLASCNQVPG